MTTMRTEDLHNTLDDATMRRVYDQFDKDGSGVLDREECAAALTCIGSQLKFEDLDADGNGEISYEEFSLLTSLCGQHTHPIFKSASKTVEAGASHGTWKAKIDGQFEKLAKEAWLRFAGQFSGGVDPGRTIRKAFDDMDLDRSGTLSQPEILRVIKQLGPYLSDVDARLMVASADKDKNANISFEEFAALMLYNHTTAKVPYWDKYGERKVTHR